MKEEKVLVVADCYATQQSYFVEQFVEEFVEVSDDSLTEQNTLKGECRCM